MRRRRSRLRASAVIFKQASNRKAIIIMYESAQEGTVKRTLNRNSLSTITYESVQEGTPPAMDAVKRGRSSESALALAKHFFCLYLRSTLALDALDLGA
jgi:hypothetical protein